MAAPPLKVAVIGAGVSGLAAPRALKRENHQVVVYERQDQLGGTWIYDPRVESDHLGQDPNREIVHSSMYNSLRANLPRQLMGLLDYPFATKKYVGSATFPGREEVLEFLNEFAAEFGLLGLIRFETEVVRVERGGEGKWVVGSRGRGLSYDEVFDAVVVCSGHNTGPRVADIPGMAKWPGKQMHSHNYRVPDPFQDQIVVVIGDGPSAKDISVEISKVAKEVHLSSRSPNTKISKLDCGDNMWQHSEIDHAAASGEVVFQDGSSVRADIILHCTGFEYDFPFLKTDGIVAVDDKRVGPLYKHVFPPQLAPTLSFIGLPYHPGPGLLIFDLQAKWIARVLSGKTSLPSKEEMLADVQEYYRNMDEKGIPKHRTHALTNPFEYSDWLAAQVELAGVDEGIRLAHKSYMKFIVDKGLWRHKEWQFGYGLQEEEPRAKLATLSKGRLRFRTQK